MRAVLVALAAVVGVAPAVGGRDRTPPAFAGLKAATTCVPGPIGERVSRYRLVWPAAKDVVTPRSRLRYDIYRASAPGGESFAAPTYTVRGSTLFMTPPLSSAETHYFVVRARDAAGNRDRNRRERAGENLCL
jgi:hypothetical protein